MKSEIIRKSMVLLGSNSSLQSSNSSSSKMENLCEEFVDGAIEEVVLSIKWNFVLKRVDNIEGSNNEFQAIPNIKDCIKVAIIVPSNLEFYARSSKIYFKGARVSTVFYYSGTVIELLLRSDGVAWQSVPQNFKLLCSLGLASQVAFAMYSDSLFADGLKKQYLIRLEEARRIYSLGYNLVNSGEV